MNCPRCGHRMKVTDSRLFSGGTVRIRKYKCPHCEYIASTDENLPEEK